MEKIIKISAIVFLIGITVYMLSTPGLFFPTRHREEKSRRTRKVITNIYIRDILARIMKDYNDNKSLPSELSETFLLEYAINNRARGWCDKQDLIVDPYGNFYVYKIENGEFVIGSKGENGIWENGENDDIVIRTKVDKK